MEQSDLSSKSSNDLKKMNDKNHIEIVDDFILLKAMEERTNEYINTTSFLNRLRGRINLNKLTQDGNNN